MRKGWWAGHALGRGAVISVLFVQQTLPQASRCYLGTVDLRYTIQRDMVLP